MGQQIRFCTTSDGVRIAYATVGQGPPIVRVLGWFTHLEYEWENPLWRTYYDRLSRRLSLVRYDGRGMGLSDREVKDFSLEAHVRDLEAVVDAVGLEKVALFGISQGGPTAIAYWMHHPDRVSHLIIYGSYACTAWRALDTDEGQRRFDALLILMRQGWGSDLPAYRQLFTSLFMPDVDPEAIRQFNEMQRISTSADNAVALFSAERHIDVRDLLPQVRAPTLVIHRRGDTMVPFESGRELATGIPGARFLALEGRNHVPAPDEPERETLCRAVEEFVGGDRKAEATAAPSGVVTVLFTDVEGSTALTQRLGDAKAREVLRTHEDTVRKALKSHGGTEIKALGDGFMASFSSATRALDCAIAIQREIDAWNEERRGGSRAAPTEGAPEIRVRIGLNAGEPIAEAADLFGTAVNLAARIAAQAAGGQILVANVVRELAAGKGFLFADRGEVALRGFENPVRLYEVAW